MRFRRGKKSSGKAKRGSSAPCPWQSGERKADGGGAGSNSRQVAPDDTVLGNLDDGTGGSSREEAFFEATPWLESDCEDDFYSVNGDLTPARSTASQTSRIIMPSGPPQDLPTLGAILKAEPLVKARKLGDLLRETQDDDDDVADEGPEAEALSRADSLRIGEEANRCCVPQLARAISRNGIGRRRQK